MALSTQKSLCDYEPERLIAEVEARPILYDKTLPEYSNRTMKDDAWEEVGEILTNDWDDVNAKQKSDICREVQLKWKHIRDNFRRELQGKCGKKRKRYRYYNQLTFLIPHVKESIPSASNTSTETVRDSFSPQRAKYSPSASQSTLRRDQQNQAHIEEEILKFLKNDIIEPDEDRTFCMSLIPSLKKMDNITKLTAKIEMLNIIRKLSQLDARDPS